MKKVASPVPLAPTSLDASAAALASIPYFPPTTRRVDVAYTLPTAIAEVDAWLHGSLTDRETRSDHRSLVTDVSDGLSQRGRHVQGRTPGGDMLLRELQHLSPKRGHTRNPAQALASLDSFTNELAEPGTALAAFNDLLEAVDDAATPRRSTENRLAVLTCTLDLAGRPVAQICHRLSDIAQDQQYEIDLTLDVARWHVPYLTSPLGAVRQSGRCGLTDTSCVADGRYGCAIAARLHSGSMVQVLRDAG